LKLGILDFQIDRYLFNALLHLLFQVSLGVCLTLKTYFHSIACVCSIGFKNVKKTQKAKGNVAHKSGCSHHSKE
jgi:hypothetical protein